MEKRFVESVEDLLAERGWSQRQLVHETQRRDNWGSSAGLSKMLNGEYLPSLEAYVVMARALAVAPEIWPEYRMARVRHEVNPERVGFAKAYKRLLEIEA